jgi:hypothetical protein
MHLRPVLALATALVLGATLTGCGADADGARTSAEKVTAPAADWTPGGQGIDRFGEDASRAGKIWIVHDGSNGDSSGTPTYEVGWEVVVKPGFEGNRCEQAARWLQKTGQGFTGTKVDDQSKAKLTDIVVACINALKPQADGANATTGFASWPALENDGYRSSAALGADVTGSVMKIYATVEVGPTDRYRS